MTRFKTLTKAWKKLSPFKR